MTNRMAQDFDRVNKLSFYSVTQLVREYGIARSTAKMIGGQPGYKANHEMAVTKAKTGGWRLFDRIGGTWMDASLEDMA
jgi:hypothetical protein